VLAGCNSYMFNDDPIIKSHETRTISDGRMCSEEGETLGDHLEGRLGRGNGC
jgi:hypothetical protein